MESFTETENIESGILNGVCQMDLTNTTETFFPYFLDRTLQQLKGDLEVRAKRYYKFKKEENDGKGGTTSPRVT